MKRAGTKLVDLLYRSNYWSKNDSERIECYPCKLAGEAIPKGQCYNRNIVYKSIKEKKQEKIEREKSTSANT